MIYLETRTNEYAAIDYYLSRLFPDVHLEKAELEQWLIEEGFSPDNPYVLSLDITKEKFTELIYELRRISFEEETEGLDELDKTPTHAGWLANQLTNAKLAEKPYDPWKIKKRFYEICRSPVQYIALSKWQHCYDDNLYDAESIIVALSGGLFKISSQRIEEDIHDFYIEALSSYNLDFWPDRIIATQDEPIFFIRTERETSNHVLRFQIGERPILVTAEEDNWVTIGLSHWALDGKWIEYDDNTLINNEKATEDYGINESLNTKKTPPSVSQKRAWIMNLREELKKTKIDWNQVELLIDSVGDHINDLVDEENCILSELMYEPEDGRDILLLVKLFLHKGFDVNAHDGMNGAMCLHALGWCTYDQYSLDIAEVLLNAGADSRINVPGISEEDSEGLLSTISFKLGYWSTGEYETANMFSALYYMVTRQQEGKDYHGIRAFDVCIGKRITKIEQVIVKEQEDHNDDMFTEYAVITCDNLLLQIGTNMELIVNPYVYEGASEIIDISELNKCIGMKIADLQYSTSTSARIELEDGYWLFLYNECGLNPDEDAHMLLRHGSENSLLFTGLVINELGTSHPVTFGRDIRNYEFRNIVIRTKGGVVFQVFSETEEGMKEKLLVADTNIYSQSIAAGAFHLNLFMNRANLICELNLCELSKNNIEDNTIYSIDLIGAIPSLKSFQILDHVHMHGCALELTYEDNSIRYYYFYMFQNRVPENEWYVDGYEFSCEQFETACLDTNGDIVFNNGYIIHKHILYYNSYRQVTIEKTGNVLYEKNGQKIISIYREPLKRRLSALDVEQYMGYKTECTLLTPFVILSTF